MRGEAELRVAQQRLQERPVTALDRVVELGGSVSIPAETTPYGVLAEALDPMGARFKLRAD